MHRKGFSSTRIDKKRMKEFSFSNLLQPALDNGNLAVVSRVHLFIVFGHAVSLGFEFF